MVTVANVAQADENMAALLLEEAKSKTKGNKDGVTAREQEGRHEEEEIDFLDPWSAPYSGNSRSLLLKIIYARL